jgi:hypothetical protein
VAGIGRLLTVGFRPEEDIRPVPKRLLVKGLYRRNSSEIDER